MPERLIEIIEWIVRDGAIHYPILVDKDTLIILDGHHRVEALRRLGYKLVPALLVDYDSDCISVSSWREGVYVTKDLVREHGLTGNLLPPKTSRHKVCFDIPRVDIQLSMLRG
ncbi:MAG: ParB N-terminal domain-containing protein [Acidilobaceae archaeon]